MAIFKSIATLAAIGLVLSSFAQAPKGVNRIVIHNDSSKQANYSDVLSMLLDQGFEIESRDIELGTIRTAPKDVPGLNANYYLYFVVSDRKITVSGKSKVNLEMNLGGVNTTSSFDQIVNKGMKGSVFKKSFEEMEKFALSISHDEVKYETF